MKPHSKWITYVVPAEWSNRTVAEVLKGPLLLSNRMINRLTRSRGFRLNGTMPWLNRVLQEGDRLQVAVRPREKADLEPEPVPFGTVWEDEDLIVIDKPAGINVHPVKPGDTGTLAHGLLHRWKEQGFEGKVRPVHRLDRYTSGLLLVAKYAYAHQLMDRELRNRRIKRHYVAIVQGRMGNGEHPSEGTIDAPIGRDSSHSLRRKVTPSGDHAVTHYRVLSRTDKATLVHAELETGRTHQIRVHFAHLGHPLFGDTLYGGPASEIRRQALHAFRLAFTHPLTGAKINITAPLPEEMDRLLRHLELEKPEEV
ncbi:RluA family pseudouridine synthase [Salinithrix halophila]|uniref:Pseudouridine synthase n=1 Tax=Salinithrix halophila TaxID=1485204 RepID=A0ABV8JJS4_9BACL